MSGWGTPREIALYVGRPIRTVRNWATAGHVPAACDIRTRRLVVHAAQTRLYAEQTGTRRRRAA